ncbi:hypothetical protein [Azospirillum argentinense]
MATESADARRCRQDGDGRAVAKPVLAQAIVRRNMWWSAGVGLLPLPLVETAAITAIQLKLIRELADLYGVPFRDDLAKPVVASLIGGLGSVALGKIAGYGVARAIPVIGVPIAAGSISLFAAGITYAVGRIFTTHFEQGGTLRDFDPEKVRACFQAEFGKGVQKASSAMTGGAVPAL